MQFLFNLFRSPDYYECKSEQELAQLQANANERMNTAKLTNKAFQAKKKTLKANEEIAMDNLEYWGEDAQTKTNVAKQLNKTGKRMGNLAPQYVGAIGGAIEANNTAQNRVAELTQKYGNVARGGNVSMPSIPGLPRGY